MNFTLKSQLSLFNPEKGLVSDSCDRSIATTINEPCVSSNQSPLYLKYYLSL